MKRRELTAEQTEQAAERRERFRELARAVSAMTPEQRVEIVNGSDLRTIEGHPLSLHNTCLILSQCPAASLVGGFRQWKAVGRAVRKGEAGLMIWIPGRTPEDPHRQDGETAGRDDKQRFFHGTVFDVSQTDEATPDDSRSR